jgi:hypothetical protein
MRALFKFIFILTTKIGTALRSSLFDIPKILEPLTFPKNLNLADNVEINLPLCCLF